MKLYSFWRSTTSFRVRAALNLKGLAYEYVPVNLLEGDQRAADFAEVNPMRGVPVLELEDGTRIGQSMAILRYLDRVAAPALLPDDPVEAALEEAAAHAIALDIHPVNNLKVLAYLKGSMGQSQDDTVAWMRHWMHEGFTAFAAQIRPDTPFCFGDTPGLADLCLTGQMINARRWGLDLGPFPRLVAIDETCRAIDAIARALPEAQPDAN